MTRKYKRRNYFIKKGEQGRFIMRFVAGSLTVTLITIAFFNYLAHKKLGVVLFSMRLPQDHGKILEGEMVLANAIAVVLIVLAFFLTARKIFSRVNGPVRKLNADIEKIGGGDLSCNVKLRDRDEFQDFAGELEEMRLRLWERFANISAATQGLAELVRPAPGSCEPDAATMQKVEKKAHDLGLEIRNFKL